MNTDEQPNEQPNEQPADGFHAARDSVREAAVAGTMRRTDRAFRRGLRARGSRR